MRTPLVYAVLLLLTGSLFGACATTQALHTESSSAAIRSAEDLGARALPQASLHLQFAKEELEAATELYAKGERAEAESLLLCAEADAELAIALSQADAERIDAQAAMERVRRLQSENPYSPGRVQ